MRDNPILKVSELFFSIQGESSYAGFPCVFLRLWGCNLRCRYCDSRYSYEDRPETASPGRLLDFVAHHPAALVAITGGEPLLQEGVLPLMTALLSRGRTVLLETNGSLSLAGVPEDVVKIMDLKCPDSGMCRHMELGNLARLTPRDEIKFVISSRLDYDWTVAIIRKHDLAGRVKLLLAPAAPLLEPGALAEWILDDHLPVRLQLQLHKILWPRAERGV